MRYISFKLIHSVKYCGKFIWQTLHCWGTFVFISQLPLHVPNKNLFIQEKKKLIICYTHEQILTNNRNKVQINNYTINESACKYATTYHVTKAAWWRELPTPFFHNPCLVIHSSNCSITCLNGIAVSCHTLQTMKAYTSAEGILQ